MLPEDLPKLELPDYIQKNPLSKARAESFAGRYKLSLKTLGKVKNGPPAQIAMIKAASLSAIGQRDEALVALGDENIANDPRIELARARLLSSIGRSDDALTILRQFVIDHPDSIPGHYYLGDVCELAGKHDEAKTAFDFFEGQIDPWLGKARPYNDAEEVTLLGRGVDRWAIMNGKYKGAEHRGLNQVVLSIFTKAYDSIDHAYWPAHMAAAEFFLRHDDIQKGMTEIGLAALGNPHSIELLNLQGEVAISSFNFDAGDAVIQAMQEINPNASEAQLLLARNLLRQQQPREAEAPLRLVLQKTPKNLEALGLWAACHALRLEDQETKDALAEVEKIDPQNATAYFEVADQLSAMRQYPRAEAMYLVCKQRAPFWTQAWNGLGLLYTQSGDEKKAEETLTAAHELDPYNYATTNYLKLLEQLDRFAQKETEHFVVYYDARLDPMIPVYFPEYLESIYASVCGDYKTEPPVKTFIEVFPRHDEFSVRTSGSPWIGTVGASTGRVIALVAPRSSPGNQFGSYNWAQVLRHEFTHTVTLAATDNRIAHWMTEGLAVYEEHMPLRWEWVPMLYSAVKTHQLFTMENLTWGFVRPKRPVDRQLAYAESYWICSYIEETYGHDAILKMLAEFRTGKQQEEVFPQILGTSIADFQQRFFDWTDKQVAGWGYDAQTSKKYVDMVKQGEKLIASRKYTEAANLWEQIAKLRPVDSLPQRRLAGLYNTMNKAEDALPHLVALDKLELFNNIYAKRVARIYRDLGKMSEAGEYGLKAVYIDPYDLSAHELLKQIYEKAGNSAGLERENHIIPELVEWQAMMKKQQEIPSDQAN